jgi:hypothetical protein
MAEKVTLKLTAAAAAYVGPDTPKEAKLLAARGDVPVSGGDLGTLLYFLGHDPDPEVRGAAIKSLRDMPESQVLVIAGSAGTHPKVLDVLARLHFPKAAVAARLLTHPDIEIRTLQFLAEKGIAGAGVELGEPESDQTGTEEEEEETAAAEESTEVDEESEEFKSKYKLSLQMGIAQKIKMALTGDKEWRSLLIKDSNKLVSGAVVKNPRITEPEVLAIAKSAIQNDEIMRVICHNKEWVKNYSIRKALVLNCKTPPQVALRFLAVLTEKDLAAPAKSKNVTSLISGQALRLLLSKKKK